MRLADVLRFALGALNGARLRTALILVAMTIGVSAVILLTGLGEGARRYVTGQFASLGTNLIIVLPGRTETQGGAPPMTSETPQDLTVQDALALLRLPGIKRIAPVNVGAANASHGSLEREVAVMGSTADLLPVRHFTMGQGQFLPEADAERAGAVCVIGHTIREELFRGEPAVGNWLRLGDRRLRVVGVLEQMGESMGVATDELIIVPVATAQQLFNTESLFRIIVEADSRDDIQPLLGTIVDLMRERHNGEEDVTVISQDAILATFDRILGALTLTVAGIAAISLLVAGVLIMNVMLVAITQRTTEIGLLKAIGASGTQVLVLFLAEAITLSMIGGVCGILLGEAVNQIIVQFYPDLPLGAPPWAIYTALAIACSTGVIFGVVPARRAARLDPVVSLARR